MCLSEEDKASISFPTSQRRKEVGLFSSTPHLCESSELAEEIPNKEN